jgi:primary-amine oxidase
MPSTTKHWLVISASIAFIFFVIIASVTFLKHAKITFLTPGAEEKTLFRASKHNVWTDLNKEEAGDVVNFLFKKSGQNLTESSKVTRYEHFFVIYFQYLDADGNLQ